VTGTRFKIGAYGVCRREEAILLTRYVDPATGRRWWTLPGGKLGHGEDPVRAVRREIEEETGHQVAVGRLLGVGSRTHQVDWDIPGGAELHSVAVYYEVTISGGALRNEVDGSTNLAAWIPCADLSGLDRAVIVDIALDLAVRRPADGRPLPVAVTGRLRN
jgi:ADP-ribose pyrophosphatase YjhB (NUDIX family)